MTVPPNNRMKQPERNSVGGKPALRAVIIYPRSAAYAERYTTDSSISSV